MSHVEMLVHFTGFVGITVCPGKQQPGADAIHVSSGGERGG